MQVLSYRRDPLVGTNPDGSEFSWTSKDRDFTTSLAPTLTESDPGNIDLRRYCTETDQVSLNACAGNATADAVEILNAIEEESRAKAAGVEPPEPLQLSRLFVYSMARGMLDEDGDGQADITKDEGTYIRLCFEILSRYGICDETVWPYDPTRVFTVPSFAALRQATGHRIHSYYRINETGEARLQAVRKALRAKHPVVFGTLVDAAFMQYKGKLTSPVGPPAGKHEGGHAMLIVGCLGDNFLVKNSWASTWGEGGYWSMSPEYLAWVNTWDLWVPTKGTVR